MKTRQAGSDGWKRIVMMWLGGVLALTQNLTADAGLVTWTGQAGDSNWHNPGNWSPASVPTTADTVLLDQGHAVIWWGDVGFASLTVGGGGVLTLDGGTISGDCTNLGTIAWQSGTLNGQMTVVTGAVLNITGGSSKTLGGALLNGGTTVVSGAGYINVNPGSGITNLAGGIFEVQTNVSLGGGGTFYNDGTVAVESGRLWIQVWKLISGGIFNAAAGTTVRPSAFESNYLSATSVLGGEGIYELGWGGGMNLNGTVEHADYGYAGGGPITGSFTNTGTFGWVSGTLNGQMTVAPGAVLNITGGSSKTLGGALLNEGTTVVSGTGGLGINSGAGITNLTGGIFEVQTNGRIGGFGAFDNAGAFHAHSGTPQFLKNFVNTGLVWIQMGTPNGSLTRLVIQGDYVQGAPGILQVELGGGIRDSLACLSVNGAARFDGTLNVTLAEGYRPSGGDHFAVAGYGSFTGAFNATNGLALGNGLDLALNYGAKILALDASDIHPRFVSCAMQSDGQFQFSIFAATGQNYLIEASTNLWDWITLTNFTGTNTALQFTDPDAVNLDRRFYRARQ
jgi:hypothetical protein